MDKIRNLTFLALAMILAVPSSFAQFKSWIGDAREDDASNAHSIYRQALKAEDWDIAFDNWKVAYELAPAADGKRDYHFIDGVKIYIHKFKNETDAAKKDEYKQNIDRLYSEAIQAYDNRDIKPTKCGDNAECYEKKKGYVLGRKGFDMYYTLQAPYTKNLEVFIKSMDLAGNDSEYIVFDPVCAMLTYQFEKGKITKDEVLTIYNKMESIAKWNLENNSKLGQYYDQAWKAAKAKLAPIEPDIFDCEYFKPKYKKTYEENPDDYETLKNVLGLLKKRGCDPSDPFVSELDVKWKKYAAEENAKRQAEFEANNPSVAAKKLYDSGDYKGAIAKYDEAIEQETDPDKLASYLFSKASIQFRKLKQYSTARNTAYKAAKAKPGWGRPYMLIGDMYGSSARSCGDDWNQRLAIIAAIDKYKYARSVDAEVSEEASARISKYRASLPDVADGHMRGKNKGDVVKVGCWIGETVKVVFK
ncbi:MAG: hypothetical protein HKN67_03020 [Saprospiraceae bacterium]|nr:hypothetical protein [Saprospiraceae bacterium]